MIHIVNPQTNEILDYITLDNIIDDTHKKSLESYIETYDAIVLGGDDFSYDKHLEKRNHIIIPDEDGTYQEFVLFEVDKYRDTEGRKTHFYAHATYLELKKAKVIYPARREGFTLSQHAGWALNNTGWRVGIVESEGVRTFNIENHTNPYEFIKRLANEFEVEIRFRVEHDGRRITARYVDFLERIGDWKGREVEFRKDLDSIRRVEKQDIVTALLGLGPERDDGTRIEVLVTDEEALQRWGRVDEHGNLHHLIEPYEIQSERTEMTEEEARRYTRTALDKRINTQVTYETTILDLEEVPGLEHEKIRFGDTIRIKDTYFNPPLYLEARVYEIERSIKNKAKKDIKLGDYIEYTEEEINAIWRQLQNEIRRRLDRMAIVSINSTAGNIFKNAQGSTELTARTFVSGAERDEEGTLYDYQWMRFDKDGNHDTSFYAEGKTITVTANDIDEKATYRVLVSYELEVINTAEITISNVFDGEDGEPGPPGPKGDKGEDGKTFYTWIKYADTPTSGMSDSPEGKEYIGIAYNKETPTPSTNYSDYVWSKFKGEQGVPGPPGEDGQPTYTWVKYADDEHGNGMSDSPEGKLYIGLAFNKTTPQESNNPADYTWSLMPQNIEVGGRNLAPVTGMQIVTGNLGDASNRGEQVDERTFKIYANPPNGTSFLFGYAEVSQGKEYILNADMSDTISSVAGVVVYDENKNILEEDGLLSGDLRWVYTYRSYQQHSEGIVKTPLKFKVEDSRVKFVRLRLGIYDRRFIDRDVLIRDPELREGNKTLGWTPAPEDVQEQIDEAKQEAEEAKQTAQQAQTTADGKNSVFTQPTAPPTTGRKIGDIWFDTSRDNLMHRFDGTKWVEAKWGERSLAAESVTALHIKSLEGLNVNDQFIVDSNGNVKFAGQLEGAKGSFISEGTEKKVEIRNGVITVDIYGFKTDITPFSIEQTHRIDGYVFHHAFGGMQVTHPTGESIAGMTVLPDGYLSIFAHEGVNRLNIDVETTTIAGDVYIYSNSGSEYALTVDGGGIYSSSNITAGSTSGYINLLPGNNHGYIEFYRTEGRAAYVGVPSAGSEYFDINAHGLSGEIRLRGRNVLVEQRLINPQAYNVTVQNPANVYVTSNGYFARSTSSKRYKTDIQYNDIDYKNILKLQQASWVDRSEFENNNMSAEGLKRYYGAIAEDFEKIGLSEFVVYNENGEVENFSDRAWVLLIPNINDILNELKEIKERLERLENEGNSV